MRSVQRMSSKLAEAINTWPKPENRAWKASSTFPLLSLYTNAKEMFQSIDYKGNLLFHSIHLLFSFF